MRGRRTVFVAAVVIVDLARREVHVQVRDSEGRLYPGVAERIWRAVVVALELQ